MRDWTLYEKRVIFRDTKKGGLLSQFLKEYVQKFGGSPKPGCGKCLDKYYNNYLNSLKMSKEQNCDYRLKLKYNGIQMGANGQPIRNCEMTNKIAEELRQWHPLGDGLFDILPGPKEDKDLKLAELRDKYPDITANSKAKFLEKLKELDNSEE